MLKRKSEVTLLSDLKVNFFFYHHQHDLWKIRALHKFQNYKLVALMWWQEKKIISMQDQCAAKDKTLVIKEFHFKYNSCIRLYINNNIH